jgi:hypothetical protein
MKVRLLIALCLWIPAAVIQPAGAQDMSVDWGGFFDTYYGLRMHSPHDTLTSRSRLRTELRVEKNDLFLYASCDAEKNFKLSDETGIEMNELYMDYVSDCWDVRIGRQIIIWGKADGLQVTDIVSPPDYTEYITRDLDEIRMGVDALKFRWLSDTFNAEFIWLPFFKTAVLPEGDNPWALETSSSGSEHYEVTSGAVKEPANTLENGELAARLYMYTSGMDIAVSAFYTWDDFPAAHAAVSEENGTTRIVYKPEHHRLTVFGLECSIPAGAFVLRGEAAFYCGRYFESGNPAVGPCQKNALKTLGGVDWYPGDNWTLTAQLLDDCIFNHDECLQKEEHTLTATLNVSKKVLRETLTISNMMYYGFNRQDVFDRFSLSYALTDNSHILAGTDIFEGHEAGSYGKYAKNSQLWFKIKYAF